MPGAAESGRLVSEKVIIVDLNMLKVFERGLDTQRLKDSTVPATLLGYGEISAIFQIGDDASIAYKRLPLFSDRASAEAYAARYNEYCGLLSQAGLLLPESGTAVVAVPNRPVCLYIAQAQLPQDRFAHRLIHVLGEAANKALIEGIVSEIERVRRFNEVYGNSLEIAVDGQLSNWVLVEDRTQPFFVDTSTPLYRKEGVEQLDPELFLKAVPGFLRWIIRWFFLDQVMSRYYDLRQVFIDLAANLYKEGIPELIRPTLEIANEHLLPGLALISAEDVARYYRDDKRIWNLFLAVRRLDRWFTTRLLGRRYEFILPGNITR